MANEDKNNNKKKNRLAHMIFSLVTAIVVWAMVAYATDPDVTKTLHNVDVRFVGMHALKENNLIVTDVSSMPDLAVKVSGKRSNMIDSIDNIVVEIDVSEIDQAGSYNLSGNVVLPNSRINLERVMFDSVPVNIDEYAEKNIPIEVRQTGLFKNMLVRSEADMKTVKISGAQKEVSEVEAGHVTVALDTIKGDGQQYIKFVMTDFSGNLITKNETIETDTPEIMVTNTVYEPVQLPIKPVLSDNLKDRYIIDEEKSQTVPETLVVGVLPDLVDSFKFIEAEVDTISDDEIECVLKEPEGMYIPEPNIKMKIKAYSSEVIQRSLKVEIKNLSDGLNTSNEAWVDCRLHGDYDYTADVTAYVDAAGLDEGTYTLPVQFEGENAYPDGEYFADITIVK